MKIPLLHASAFSHPAKVTTINAYRSTLHGFATHASAQFGSGFHRAPANPGPVRRGQFANFSTRSRGGANRKSSGKRGTFERKVAMFVYSSSLALAIAGGFALLTVVMIDACVRVSVALDHVA